jgi:hypothetical protein
MTGQPLGADDGTISLDESLLEISSRQVSSFLSDSLWPVRIFALFSSLITIEQSRTSSIRSTGVKRVVKIVELLMLDKIASLSKRRHESVFY